MILKAGKYIFNEKVDVSKNITLPIRFANEMGSFQGITVSYAQLHYGDTLVYDPSTFGWKDVNYRLVDVRNDQDVTDTVYNWFIKNTTSTVTKKVNGKWYFNETLNDIALLNVNTTVSFLSNGTEYVALLITNMMGNRTLEYGKEGYNFATGRGLDTAYDVTAFTDEAYRTIDFGAAYQEVSDEFYTWLTANAVQLSKPIPMEHPKGIRLLTKGKKCTEDIEVVPTFLESVSVSITDLVGVEFTIICTTCDNGTLDGFLGYVDANTITIDNVLKGSILSINCGLENDLWKIDGDYKHISDYDPNRLVIQVNGDLNISNV